MQPMFADTSAASFLPLPPERRYSTTNLGASRRTVWACRTRLARLVHAVDREDVLGEIDANVQNGDGIPLPSELMRVRTSLRVTVLSFAASRLARDGEVSTIR